jgi:hypothetical protein
MGHHFELIEAGIIHTKSEGNILAEEFRAATYARVAFAKEKLGESPYSVIYDILDARLLILDPRLTTWSMEVDKNLRGVAVVSTQLMATVGLNLFKKISSANVAVVPTLEEAIIIARAMLEKSPVE